jgi:glutathione S-transferase
MRVRTALAEKGLPYRARELEPGERVPIQLNGNATGVAPVLVDGDAVLVGATAIVSHLCARWPEPPLLEVEVGRDRVIALCERIDGLFEPHLPRIDRGAPTERVAALGEVRKAMAEIDSMLNGSPYLLPVFSLADLTLASWMAKLPRDWRPAQLGLERLARWERTVMARPSVREQMGPRFPAIQVGAR